MHTIITSQSDSETQAFELSYIDSSQDTDLEKIWDYLEQLCHFTDTKIKIYRDGKSDLRLHCWPMTEPNLEDHGGSSFRGFQWGKCYACSEGLTEKGVQNKFPNSIPSYSVLINLKGGQ